MKCLTACAGVALLEAAVVTALISLFGFAGCGVAGYLFDLMTVRSAVESVILDGGERPRVLEGDSGGTVHLRLNRSGMEEFLRRTARTLTHSLEREGEVAGAVVVEVGYGVARIDPRSGEYRGMEGPVVIERNGAWPDTGMDECPSLLRQFDLAAGGQAGETSPAALPSAVLSPESAAGYLDRSILVGVRVRRDLAGTAGGALAALALRSTEIVGCKVEIMRSEVG